MIDGFSNVTWTYNNKLRPSIRCYSDLHVTCKILCGIGAAFTCTYKITNDVSSNFRLVATSRKHQKGVLLKRQTTYGHLEQAGLVSRDVEHAVFWTRVRLIHQLKRFSQMLQKLL